MATSLSLRLAFVLLAFVASEAAAVTPAGSNPPGVNGNIGEAPKFIGGGTDLTTESRKAKTASAEIGSPVNKAGTKGATTAASRGGRVFLTRSWASLAAAGDQSGETRKSTVARTRAGTLVTAKAEKPVRQQPPRSPGENRDLDEVAAPPPDPAADTGSRTISPGEPHLAARPNPMPAVAFSETPVVAPPTANASPQASQLPGLDGPDESRERAVERPAPATRGKPFATLPDSARDAAGALTSGGGSASVLNRASPDAAVVLATLPVGAGSRNASKAMGILPWYYPLAALLLFFIGLHWIYGAPKSPWLSYTEDWMDGFLWRWEWKKAEMTNLRGFCPTCRSQVIFRPVATGKNAPPPSEPPGTWAYCPACKEATCLEMNDVSQTITTKLTRKKNSGEYRETVTVSKQKAGVASGRAVRVKLIEGRVL